MEPLDRIPMASSEATIQEIELSLKSQYVPYMPLYYKKPQNIVGILYTRDLLTLAPDALIRDVAKSPWFITERNSLFQILKQFQWNNQHIAVVLDRNGHATGILTLDALVEELFAIDPIEVSQTVIVNRSFSADTEVSVINQTLRLSLPEGGTLEDLMTRLLGHAPSKLERIRVKQVELTLESSPLLADKTIRIQSL